MTQVTELPSIPTSHGRSIKVFQLQTPHGFAVELSSVGASIIKLLFPNGDDVVLGYKSPLELYESHNPPFLGVIVGRVANRIKEGKFHLNNTDYSLAINNPPNHLHGGEQGFSTRLWDTMEIIELDDDSNSKAVQCTLVSKDGDQGYPGSVKVTATYSMHESGNHGTVLRLEMKAQLLPQDNNHTTPVLSTPINLAQHSYFNLAHHNHKEGILDHSVTLNCSSYTPTDATSIPTRQVVAVKDDPAMDLTTGALMREVLKNYAVAKAGLTTEQATQHLQDRTKAPLLSGTNCPTPNQPYGIDHNYVVPQSTATTDLSLVGTIEHAGTKRKMTVSTTAPGVQVYTGNYLEPLLHICKDGASYRQWQGMCFETQHYPDSITSTVDDQQRWPEFHKGKCVILTPEQPHYHHVVEYCLEQL